MVKSFQNLDKPYRRGLVLGLSLAETFLILLFLLLLASIGLVSLAQEELVEAKNENQELRDGLEAIYDVAGGKITIEEFTRLVRDASAKQKLIRENQELRDGLSAISEAAGEEITVEELSRLAKDASSLQTLLGENEALTKQLEAEQNRLSKARDKIARQEQIIEEYAKKGQDPPCWFVKVADADAVGGIRERHVKIFDVKIEDTSFIVRWHDNSNINLEIHKGNEYALPTVEIDDLNVRLSAARFSEIFMPFLIAGETKKIHNYKCRFMADVYDSTSPNNKSGYKRNLKVLENIFYKFEENITW